ncbi:MAG: hypothetical protein LC624_02250 [Halobacteriales archaeon]|nr:hypothetical protein [Halobacteriales archaeon]
MPSDLARRAALACLLGLGLVVPGLAGLASAAPARVGLAFEPLAPVPPGTTVHVAGNLTYSYDAQAANASRIALLLDAPIAWLHASLTPDTFSVAANHSGNRTVVPLTLSVTVDPGAPALAQQALVVRVLATGNPPLEAAQATVSVSVQAAFQGKLRVEPRTLEPQRPGDPFNLGLNVTAEGNGPERVTIEANSSSAKLRVVAPSPFILEQGETRVANISVLAEAQEAGTINITYGSTYAFDASLRGDQGALSVPVRVTQSQVLPGFEPLLALAAVGCALLTSAARRCR